MQKAEVVRNSDIGSLKLILINIDGTKLGEKTKDEALSIANSQNMDLVQVKEGDVPICRLMDYSKTKYKKQKQIKPKKVKRKEVRFGMNIAENDLNVKTNHVKKFLEKGNQVKIVLHIKGRHSISNNELNRTFSSILNKIDIEYRKDEIIKNNRLWSISLSP